MRKKQTVSKDIEKLNSHALLVRLQTDSNTMKNWQLDLTHQLYDTIPLLGIQTKEMSVHID